MPYMIEGEWLGYTSRQDRIVHRHYTSKKEALKIEAIGYGIYFTDGTTLALHITFVHRRKLPTIYGYSDLISDCVTHGVNSVNALIDVRKKQNRG